MSVTFVAFSDIHLPIYKREFIEEVSKLCSQLQPDLLLAAGDVVDRGKWDEAAVLEQVYAVCRPAAFLAVFGNDEYQETRDKIRSLTPHVRWLDNEEALIDVKGVPIRAFGSTGILDEPTRWQAKNIPNIREVYQKALESLRDFCSRATADSLNFVIMHYPPTFKTLQGEPLWAWRQMGSARAEEVIVKARRCDYVIHGHAHNSRKLTHVHGNTTFINVAFPARKGLYVGKASLKRGLEGFIKGGET